MDYRKIPVEFTGALDKVLYQLEMISRTVIALEQRVGISDLTRVIAQPTNGAGLKPKHV